MTLTSARRPGRAAALACAIAIASGAVAVRYGVFTASGADQYGYISQSELWVKGALRTPQPIALRLPPVFTDDTLAPLGYRPAHRVGVFGGLVPTYAPGLPLIMAAFRVVAGPNGVYGVVPLLAVLTIWCTFLFGRRLAGPAAGVASALLVATSPAFIVSSIRPMSDVPAAAWWALALVLATGTSVRGAAGAGAAVAMAVLTRPNLVPLGAVLGAWFVADAIRRPAWNGSAVRRLVAFAGVSMLGPICVGVLQAYLYGSPLRSGYGTLEELYAWSNVTVNVGRYLGWLTDTRTYFVFAGLAGPVVLTLWRRGQPDEAQMPDAPGGWSRASVSWLAVGCALTVVVLYLPYIVFREWEYLRFILPAFPPLAALACAALVHVSARGPKPAAAEALVVLTLLAGGLQLADVSSRGVFRFRELAPRDRILGRYLAWTLPPDAILFTMQQSGSARYYSGRFTVRYDRLPANQLETIVRDLVTAGFRPYFLLEEWEEPQFKRTFAANALGALDWPPAAKTELEPTVRLYDPLDRPRMVGGETVRTQVVR